MTSEQFCYWLQGRAELDPTPPTQEQWQSIREHLATVFQKVTPPIRIPGVMYKDGPDHVLTPITTDWGLPAQPSYQPLKAIC